MVRILKLIENAGNFESVWDAVTFSNVRDPHSIFRRHCLQRRLVEQTSATDY
jgi:hypothetical protein